MCTYIIIFIKNRCQSWLFWRDWWHRFFWFLKHKKYLSIHILMQTSKIKYLQNGSKWSMLMKWSMHQYDNFSNLTFEYACNHQWLTSIVTHSQLLQVWWIWDSTSSPSDCSCLSLSWRFYKVLVVFQTLRPRHPPPVWDGGMCVWLQALLLPQCYKRQA